MFSTSKNGSAGALERCTRPSFSRAHFPDFLESNRLRPLQPPTATTFPSWFELAGAVDTGTRPEPKQELFSALIGDARVLFQELLDDPSRFEEGVAELLQQLINSRRTFEEMTPEERDLLNRAAIDFATNKSAAPKKVETPSEGGGMPAAARAAMSSEDEEPELEWGESGRHVPLSAELPDSPPTFWWQKV